MGLLSEIISDATNSPCPLSVQLRRCLILAYQVKNKDLELLVNHELDGYRSGSEVPIFRHIITQAMAAKDDIWLETAGLVLVRQ
jgi:hypothetical protein